MMRVGGPKCAACGKKIQLMSYDSAYLKLVRPGEAKGVFLCWKCAEREFGSKINEIGKE